MAGPKRIRESKRHERGWGAGSVKEVRPGVWRAFRARVHRPDGSTVRPSKTFTGPTALAEAASWALGEPQTAVMYLGQWLERWLALLRPTLAPNTYAIYTRHVDACGDLLLLPLADVTVDQWQAQTNKLLDRWSRYHVYVWRGNIASALAGAIPGHIAANPLKRVKLPKPDEQPPKVWRQPEVDCALATAADGLHETWLLFTLGTGVRLGEALALLWADVDWRARTATIRQSADNRTGKIGPTKTRKVRVIDIPEEVMAFLSAHQKRQRIGELYVFGHGGRPYNSNAPRRWLGLQCKAAQVTPTSPHGLRHTYASLALDAGVPVQDVARQLGHTVATCQRVYAHFIGDGQRRAANAFGAAIRHRFSGPKRLPGAKNGTQQPL